MNKQELIDYCNVLKESKSRFINCIDVDRIIEAIKQLDKPQPVKVPQFVADWLSNLKSGLFGLNYDSVSSEIYDWVYDTEDNLGKLHLAFVYGYEVEKEKRYYVRFKWIEESYSYLTFIKHLYAWTLSDIKLDKKFRSEHTRKQLEEADFGWVFDCPGIEVEEVEG